MRYKKEILIAGAQAIRRERSAELSKKQKENFEVEERILQQYTDDQPEIEKIARRIVQMAENAEEITSDFLTNAFRTPTADRRMRTLGLDREALNRNDEKIKKVDESIEALEKEPLLLVEFLEAIEDDMVSDYGLKQAGFSIRTSELITKGMEELRADKEAERQTAEAGV